jgi:tRNA(Ile)-lysidine synthase
VSCLKRGSGEEYTFRLPEFKSDFGKRRVSPGLITVPAVDSSAVAARQSWVVNAEEKMKGGGRFASRLLAEWKRLALPQASGAGGVVVAVSGGADSVALLLALDSLVKTKRLALSLTVAHLDHGLRPSGQADARWVEDLAATLGIESRAERVQVRELAAKSSDNLEQAARGARYEFLRRVSLSVAAQVLVTAHTMDDQAETVLLRLLRGSAAEGLGGIEPVRPFAENSGLLLARPLLNWARRTATVEYCRERGVAFRTDEMNEDERFARVRVRRSLIPLMREFNGRVVEALARTAALLREDARLLDRLALGLLDEARVEEGAAGACSAVSVKVLAPAPEALRRRALRRWLAEHRGDLRRLEMVHLLAVERLLAAGRGGRYVELPGGARVSRRRGSLLFHPKKVENEGEPV